MNSEINGWENPELNFLLSSLSHGVFLFFGGKSGFVSLIRA